MNVITTLLDRSFIAVSCILGWAVFPLFIALGVIALFVYAFIAEVLAPASESVEALESRQLANRAPVGVRLRETLQP